MLRVFTIWISLGIFSLLNAQGMNDNFKLTYPDFVLQGNRFEISIITSNEFLDADKLDLYIIPHRGIKVEKILLRTESGEEELPFSGATSEGYLYDAVMTNINFDNSQTSGGSFFQILITLQSDLIDYSEIEFYGEFVKGGRVVDYLQTSNIDLQGDYPNHYSAKINFYEKTGAAGKSLLLDVGSVFAISPQVEIEHNLLVDFWAKFNIKEITFLNIINRETNSTGYRVSTNEFQILTAESDIYAQKSLTPDFVSNDVWHHFSVLISPVNNSIEFFCNDNKFSEYEFPASVSVSNLEFEFVNNGKGVFQLDQIRFIDLNEDLNPVWRSSNFQSFVSDSSKLKLQFNFNENDIGKYNSDESIRLQNVSLVESDAPIFTRAPELNMRVLSNYYELEWRGGDVKSAVEYIVERSDDGIKFEEIAKLNADNTEAKNYTYLGEKRKNSEVVYFRIKQVNKDGSVVYSSQVKVGQGETEDFIIEQNYPNPFNPSTQITVELLEDTDIEIVVYNLEGKTVAVLHRGYLSKGVHKFKFDGSELPSGIYLYKVSSPNFSQTKKMILAK